MRERYHQIVELSHDCIMEIGLDGAIQAINRTGLRMLGATEASQVVGSDWRTLWPRESAPLIDAALHAAARGEPHGFQSPYSTLAGRLQDWHVTTNPLFDDAGNVVEILAIGRDITDRTALEAAFGTLDASLQQELRRSAEALERSRAREDSLSHELHAARERRARSEGDLDLAKAAQRAAETIASQAQKGEAIGQLLAGVVHDLNNVLQAATSAVDMVRQRGTLDERDAKLLAVAESALQHGAVMTQRLIGFSRQHPYHPESVELGELALELRPLLGQAVGSGMHLVLDTSGGGCCAMVDRHTVERALMNLVINARDACDIPGEIRIETGTLQVPAGDATLARPSGSYVTLSVTDNGHGMSEDVLAHLFEAYFTTKGADKGTGLGLAQVYGAVRQAGGFIDVSSAPGQGARFLLAFPRVSRDP